MSIKAKLNKSEGPKNMDKYRVTAHMIPIKNQNIKISMHILRSYVKKLLFNNDIVTYLDSNKDLLNILC